MLGLDVSSIKFEPERGRMSASARGECDGPAPGDIGYLLLGVDGYFPKSPPPKGVYFCSIPTAGLDREYECDEAVGREADAERVVICGSVAALEDGVRPEE